MKIKLIACCLLLASCGYLPLTQAQTTQDGLMMPKGEVCVAVLYEHASWDRYWEGAYLRNNANMGTFSRQSLSPMLVAGVGEHLNVFLSLPYVATAATGGQLAGVEGIQDLSLAVKAKLITRNIGKGKLTGFSSLSFSTPASNYLSDYLPFSLGMGTNELSLRAIGLYERGNGPYLRGSVAYLHRGTTEAERDFYYNEGAYYTSTMDVPDALTAQVALGSWLFGNKLRVEASFTSFRCASGDDIRIYAMPQPTNKVDFERIEGFAQYYFKEGEGLGIIGYYHHLVGGRNMGQFSGVGLGLTYQFKTFKRNTHEK